MDVVAAPFPRRAVTASPRLTRDGALLLGSSVRLFDNLAGTPSVLCNPTVVAGVGVTDLRYPVRKA
jgi:hypothetical protein